MTATDRNADDPFRPAPTALLIAASPDAASDGEDAVAAAGARLVATVPIAAAIDAIERYAMVDLILVEARGADVDALGTVIDAIGDRPTGASIVVAFDIAQIDLVAPRLLTGPVHLLCDPTVADRVAALVLATRASGSVRERDTEAERLRRLNEEVARIAETLARLTRGEGSAARDMLGDRTLGYRAGPQQAAATGISGADVRKLIRARRLRDQFFPAGLLEDPAWDMLLDLFAADLERAQVSVSSLCIAAAVAPTTALRWIGRMTEEGLFERTPDPFDRRRAFMILSDAARTAMQGYWAALQRSGALAV